MTSEPLEKELQTKIELYTLWVKILSQLRERIPDVQLTWYSSSKDRIEYHAKSVDQNWSEIACNESSGYCGNGRVYARSIQIIQGERIKGTLVSIGSYGHYHGYIPEENWQENIKKQFGEKAIPFVQSYLDTHPYKEYEDEEEGEYIDPFF
jgi:hypothetical protein